MDQELLEQYLADRDEPCPGCGYSLRGLTGAKCPECGDALRLHVGLVEPRKAVFLTGLIGLAAGGGFCALLLGYFAIFILTRTRFSSRNVDDVVVLIGGTVLSAALLIAWVRGARRIRHLPSASQWILAAGCCLTAPIYLFIFAAVVD